jgi:hypothetical protein
MNHDDWRGYPLAKTLKRIPEGLLKTLGVAALLLLACIKASVMSEILGVGTGEWIVSSLIGVALGVVALIWAIRKDAATRRGD